MTWILLTLVYGLLKGFREIAKKKALGLNTVLEVLIMYTLLSFLMVIPGSRGATLIEVSKLPLVAFKSFVIFLAWMCSFYAIRSMPISIVGILDMSRIMFATLLGFVVLQETATKGQMTGLLLVCAGLFALRFSGKYYEWKAEKGKLGGVSRKKEGKVGEEKVSVVCILLVFASCVFNAVSATLDKVLMKDMTSAQLQFWYMLFLAVFYLVFLLVSRKKISWKSLIKNKWIWALSLMIVIADRCLFIANGIPESKVTIMTLIKQAGCIVTIIGGRVMFKEKNTGYKLVCAAVVITGVMVAVLSKS